MSTTVKERYMGEAPLNGRPDSKLGLVLKDGVVTTQKIADGAVTGDKLSKGFIEDTIIPIIDEKVDPLKDNIIKHVFLTEAEYQELVDGGEVEPDVLYFTTENV